MCNKVSIKRSAKLQFLLVLVFTLTLFKTSTSQINSLPTGFSDHLLAGGFNQVQGFIEDSIGRHFCWERSGFVIIVDTNGNKLPTLIDIKEEVGAWGDHGLNAVLLDPNFEQNGFIYLFYAVDRHYLLNFGTPSYNTNTNQYYEASIARVTRYTCNPATNFTTIIPNSRLILLGKTKNDGIPIVASNHGGGGMAFGADGSLIIATGDGSVNGGDNGSTVGSYWQQALNDSIIKPFENIGCYKSQSIQALNGKLLRINPANGNGYPSNPYFDIVNPSSAPSLMWAIGLRNPFRITIKPGTGSSDVTAGNPGTFIIGDVGASRYEELDECDAAGQNFGWPIYEGLTTNPDFVGKNNSNVYAPNPLFGINGCTQQYFTYYQLVQQPLLTGQPVFNNPCNVAEAIPQEFAFVHKRPLIEYKHSGNITRTGNYNGNIASEISVNDPNSPVTGNLFAGSCVIGGDFYSSNKFPIAYQNNYFFSDYSDKWIKKINYINNEPVSVSNFASNAGTIVYIKMGSNGCLQYINYTSELRQICFDSIVNNSPTAKITLNNNAGSSPLEINFNGQLSEDPENDSLTFTWDFNDSTFASGITTQHTFTASTIKKYWVKVYVSDLSNNTAVDSVFISINNTAPTVSITSISPNQGFSTIANTTLNLMANVSDAEHTPEQLHYKWETILVHNQHQHPYQPDTDFITTTTLSPVGCDGEIYFYIIRLTVTDDGGLQTTDEIILNPICGLPVKSIGSSATNICQNTAITFNDNSSNGVTAREWTFTGGTPATSTLSNPVITYSIAGTYPVKLIVCNQNGCDSIIANDYITINPLPAAIITANGPLNFCELGNVTLAMPNVAGNTYQWQRNQKDMNGKTSATLFVDASGSYKVRVTNNLGCSTFSNVFKTKVLPDFDITVTGSLNLCGGSSVTLAATYNASYSYKWRKSGVKINGATNYDYTTINPSSYSVRVTDSISGCSRLSSSYVATSNCRNFDSSVDAFPLSAVVLYPNPVNDFINLTFNVAENTALSFELFDLFGRKLITLNSKVFTNGEQNYKVNISTFTAGIYQLRILSNNKQLKSLKVIKE